MNKINKWSRKYTVQEEQGRKGLSNKFRLLIAILKGKDRDTKEGNEWLDGYTLVSKWRLCQVGQLSLTL